jgi:hypothetical protein
VLADFLGISYDQMLLLQESYVNAGVSCDLTLDKDVSSLAIHDATANYTLDTWQIFGADSRKDLLSHPAVLSITGLDQKMTKDLRDFVSGLSASTDAVALMATAPFSGVSGGNKTILENFLTLYEMGGTEFDSDAENIGYVLRHTTNAPNRWGTNIADFNTGLVYTPAHLLSEAGDGTLWILPLPARMAYKITNFVAPASVSGFTWGWKKSRSTESTAANNRIDIVTEYLLGRFNTANVYTIA